MIVYGGFAPFIPQINHHFLYYSYVHPNKPFIGLHMFLL